jgi:hypothetical protein
MHPLRRANHPFPLDYLRSRHAATEHLDRSILLDRPDYAAAFAH